jgi:dTDP-4-amino-4,6-dideoxygalactose transaminase
VITSPFTFIASANSIAMIGAIPIFVDINLDTYNIDHDAVRAAITKKTNAILPVHIFGMPADMNELMEIAEEHDLQVLEDACQAHGASIDGKMIGSIGHAGTFSFYATKNMMTGEGGMITSNDEEIIERALMIKNHGRGKQGGYSHFRIGYNYRMMDIVSALGRVQLKRMDGVLAARRKNAMVISKMLAEYEFVKPQIAQSGFESGYHVYAPRLYSDKITRDEMIQKLKDRGVGSRTVYALPCHKQDTYLNIDNWRWARFVDFPDYSKVSLPNSEEVGDRHFEIPVHPGVGDDELATIDSAIHDIFSK